MEDKERQVTDTAFNDAVTEKVAAAADRDTILEKYGLSEKDVKRYKAFCAGETPKKWDKHRDRILTAFERMTNADAGAVL